MIQVDTNTEVHNHPFVGHAWAVGALDGDEVAVVVSFVEVYDQSNAVSDPMLVLVDLDQLEEILESKSNFLLVYSIVF